MAAGITFNVVFQNNSTSSGTACLYQTGAGLSTSATVYSVGWLTQSAAPTTKVVFTWQTSWDFVWSECGALGEGAIIGASQTWPAGTLNQVTFTKTGGIYTFADQTTGPDPASLYTKEDASIPANMAAVGIGMSGRAAMVVQAQPNTNLIFTPQPAYFITFGNYTRGEILDPKMITSSTAVVFPLNVYTMAVTLNPDNTWNVTSTIEMNAALTAQRAAHRRKMRTSE